MVRRKTLMTAILAVALCAAICLAILPFGTALASDTVTPDSDWSGSAPDVTVSVNETDTQLTDITIPYAQNGHAVFGGISDPFKVASDAFKLDIKINGLKEGQRFALSFVKDTNNMPFDGATGISFVFDCVKKKGEDGLRLRLFIVDSADGGLINEMKQEECGSMWAYQKDGYDNEFARVEGEEHYSYGYVGSLNPASIEGQTLQFVNVIDGASFGGTTNRPGITTGAALGTTVPGIAFTARGLEKDNVIMVLSAVAGESSDVADDLRFTVNVPDDKLTKEYARQAAPVKTEVRNIRENAAQAAAGALSAEEYTALTEEYAAIDLTALRPRDMFLQRGALDEIATNLAKVEKNAADVQSAVTAYGNALGALDPLDEVTEENTDAARSAKTAFDELAPFVKYAANRAELEQAIAALPVNNLARAEVELAVRAFETAVAEFESEVTAQKIFDAETARAAIDEDKLAKLDSADKDAFTQRISACDEAVATAREENAQAVEELKIRMWKTAVDALGSEITDYEKAAAARPVLNMQGVDESGQAALNAALANADEAFEAAINAELGRWHSAYVRKTDELVLEILTQDKIHAAKEAAYNGGHLQIMQRIAGGGTVSYNISEAVAALEECDRLVSAAEAQLWAVLFKTAADGVMENGEQIGAAFRLYESATEADLYMLTEDEKAAYDDFLQKAVTTYEQKAKAVIGAAVEAFTAAANSPNLHKTEVMRVAKAARAAVPDIAYLLTETDRTELQTSFDEANAILTARPIYYADSTGPSWTISETDQGILLENKLNNNNGCEGLAIIEGAYDISTLDFAFDFTKIGRVWKGAEDGKNPRSIYVLNIKNAPDKNKDEAMGFTVFFVPNTLNQIEVEVYLPDAGEPITRGVVEDVPVTADPFVPFTVRVRVSRSATGYTLSVNTLSLNLSYRQFINPEADKTAHMPEFEAGSEIGQQMFRNDKAYLNFVVFAESLTEEERSSAVTIRMIGDKTFGNYTPPVLTEYVELVSGPNKTTYAKGEQFDKTGIVMKATLSDGTVVDIPLDAIRVLGFTSTSRGEKSVTLSYTDGNGDTFNKVIKITVVDAVESGEPEDEGCGCSGAISTGSMLAAIGALLAAGLLITRKKFGKSEK